jgi:hypothetical protein
MEPLINRSHETEHWTVTDPVYHATINQPTMYPQDDLCADVELMKSEIPVAINDEWHNNEPAEVLSSELDASSNLIKHKDTRALSDLNGRAVEEIQEVSTHVRPEAIGNEDVLANDSSSALSVRKKHAMMSADIVLPSIMEIRTRSARQAFCEIVPHTQTLGEVKDEDMPELGKDGIVKWSENEVDSVLRCDLCLHVSFSFRRIESQDGEGRLTCHVSGPRIITNDDGHEVQALLPSFNRMMLNCQGSKWSQCSLIFSVLLTRLSLATLVDETPFDRESLIGCYISLPISSMQEYMDLLCAEVSNDMPRPFLAPELLMQSPRRRDAAIKESFRHIPLLIENCDGSWGKHVTCAMCGGLMPLPRL